MIGVCFVDPAYHGTLGTQTGSPFFAELTLYCIAVDTKGCFAPLSSEPQDGPNGTEHCGGAALLELFV